MISASAAGKVDALVGVTLCAPMGIRSLWLLSRLGFHGWVVYQKGEGKSGRAKSNCCVPTYCTVPPGVELLDAAASAPPSFAK
jgi:hypothetical protein